MAKLQSNRPSSDVDPSCVDIRQHPVTRDTAILPTRQIEEFINAIRTWLEYLLPGAIVWGNFRTGKTQAIRYLMANAANLLGSPIPVFLLSIWDPENQPVTENRFYQEMLYVLGYELPNSGTGAVKRRRVIDYLVERVRENKEHRVLLFVDEAQWLSTKALRCLMDLHNQLKIADVRLVVILVGQPELLDLKEALRSSRQGHLVGRFMTCDHRFDGIVSHEDLSRILGALDTHSEYPLGSGLSYTEFFIPNAFRAGWRLQDQSRSIWQGLVNAVAKEPLPRIKELPMQALSALIRALLQGLREIDGPELKLSSRMIETTIYRVAFPQIQDHLLQTQPNAGRRGGV